MSTTYTNYMLPDHVRQQQLQQQQQGQTQQQQFNYNQQPPPPPQQQQYNYNQQQTQHYPVYNNFDMNSGGGFAQPPVQNNNYYNDYNLNNTGAFPAPAPIPSFAPTAESIPGFAVTPPMSQNNNATPSSFSSSTTTDRARSNSVPRTRSNSVPDDVVATQERLLAEYQNKKSESRSGRMRNPNHSHRRAHSTDGSIIPYNRSDVSSMVVPQSRNPMGSDAVHPAKKMMKKQRKAKTMAGVCGGAAVGTLVLGPIGTVLGGAAGGVAVNKIAKAGEKRAQRKHEQQTFQRATESSSIHTGSFA